MNPPTNLIDYINKQMKENPLLKEINKNQYPYSHDAMTGLKACFNSYLDKGYNDRWITILGPRGIGKTTLMAQFYNWIYDKKVKNKPKSQAFNMIYMSLDIVRDLGEDLMEALKAYKLLLKNEFEDMACPVLLFIDEVQRDPQWAKILKIIYDRTSNIFIVSAGSSAAYSQMDADTAGRRSSIKRLHSLSYIEYQKLIHNHSLNKEIKQELYSICYYSHSAKEVYKRIKERQYDLDQAWFKYKTDNVEQYLHLGTMPFHKNQNEEVIYKNLINNVDKIINNDLICNEKSLINQNSVLAIKQLLIFIANNDNMPSLRTLANILKINIQSLSKILDALVEAEILTSVTPYSNKFGNPRLPINYRFSYATLRTAYWNITGYKQTTNNCRKQLLKDIAASYYYRAFRYFGPSLNYLYTKKDIGHCDFTLQTISEKILQIALGFSFDQSSIERTEFTVKKIKCNYGLAFCNSSLNINKETKTVIIPLRYFFLM